jgi:hypothetical protein
MNLEKTSLIEQFKDKKDKALTKFDELKYSSLEKIGINNFLRAYYFWWGAEIKEEINEKLLAKKYAHGMIKTLVGYPLIFGTGLISLISQNPLPFVLGGSVSSYLELKGKAELIAAQKRMNKLNLNPEELVKAYFQSIIDK